MSDVAVEHPLVTDERELQWRLVYSIIVAGKTATFADDATARLFADRNADESPFDYLRRARASLGLGHIVRHARTGNYTKLQKAMEQLCESEIVLTTCTIEDLEKIHGVGPKTSRFFLLWTRPDTRCAALDVHILRWLRANGCPSAPRATPGSKKIYRKLEASFLAAADRLGLTPRQLDHKIWSESNVAGIK